MKYEILKSSSHVKLTELVEKRILQGWKPQGGAQIIASSSYLREFYQTMTLDETPPKAPGAFGA